MVYSASARWGWRLITLKRERIQNQPLAGNNIFRKLINTGLSECLLSCSNLENLFLQTKACLLTQKSHKRRSEIKRESNDYTLRIQRRYENIGAQGMWENGNADVYGRKARDIWMTCRSHVQVIHLHNFCRVEIGAVAIFDELPKENTIIGAPFAEPLFHKKVNQVWHYHILTRLLTLKPRS